MTCISVAFEFCILSVDDMFSQCPIGGLLLGGCLIISDEAARDDRSECDRLAFVTLRVKPRFPAACAPNRP